MHCACNAESPTRFQLKSRRQGFSPLGVIALCPDISWEMMSNQVSWPDMRHSLQVPGGQPGQDPHHSGHTHTPHTVRKNSAKIEISRNIYSWGGVQVIYRWNLSDIWVSCHPWVNIRWNFNFRRFFSISALRSNCEGTVSRVFCLNFFYFNKLYTWAKILSHFYGWLVLRHFS